MSFVPPEKLEVQRISENAVTNQDALYQVLDKALLAHVGFMDLEINQPFVLPMAFVRHGDSLLLHGSTASRFFRNLSQGANVCATVTTLEGIVVARSTFNSSMRYHSIMVFGTASELTGVEKDEGLRIFSEKYIPGHFDRARPMLNKERAATMLLALSIDQITGKFETGGPNDDPADIDLSIWAGVIPIKQSIGPAIPAANLPANFETPDYIKEIK